MTGSRKGSKQSVRRRAPKQRRAQQTVEAVLDAVARLVKRGSVEGITTNRIAATAGVSIGSLYQYFPDKRAILVAVRDRHVEQMGRLVERTLVSTPQCRSISCFACSSKRWSERTLPNRHSTSCC